MRMGMSALESANIQMELGLRVRAEMLAERAAVRGGFMIGLIESRMIDGLAEIAASRQH